MQRRSFLCFPFATLFLAACAVPATLGGLTIAETFQNQKVADLVQAAVWGDADTVARLAGAGADVNAQAPNGATPLFWAVNAKSLRGIEALLQAGADPNLVTPKVGEPVMTVVAGSTRTDILRLLLKYGADPNHIGDGRLIDRRPLVFAALHGQIENMKVLIDARADVNAHDQYRESAASATLGLGKFDALSLLLERGYEYDLPGLLRRLQIRRFSKNVRDQQNRLIEIVQARIAGQNSSR